MEKAEVESRIDLEETGLTSIHQMVILKNNYLLPNNKFRVGLVTDEIHMPRLKIHAAHIFGEQFTLTEYAAEVRISGKYRTAVQEVEDKLLELTAKNPVLLGYPSGDDKTWLLYDEFYRRRKQELGVYLADINQEFVEYLKARK